MSETGWRIAVLQPMLHHETHDANLQTIAALLEGTHADLILLPELFFRTNDVSAYQHYLQQLAARTGALVVGGSFWMPQGERCINAGFVVSPAGEIVARYSKRHPYGREQAQGVCSGAGPVRFAWRGGRVAVMICADLWDRRLVADVSLDCELLCVVAESVAEAHPPGVARTLWHQLMAVRAYEGAQLVAVSDWAEAHHPDGSATCGVAGVVDPGDLQLARVSPPVSGGVAVACCEWPRLMAHRQTRRQRTFLF
ncbi:MAG: carbon-nitrogen hydrolase family protein [Deltaproteobacteria bacterium]|nr:carbon-nitrogen hydrolase family protein [Deltaproteobacteria bacterium]